MKHSFNSLIRSTSLALVLASALHSWAGTVSVEELATQLVDGRAPVIVDVRLSKEFSTGHIPNAINIPLPALEARQLPRLGAVIVYDDGMGRGDIEEAVALLNAKPGIEATSLAGGYAAWQTRSGVTTDKKGLQVERQPMITYSDLVATGGEGVTLYDLRAPQEGFRVASTGSDLRSLLPMARQASGSPLALLEGEAAAAPASGARLASVDAGSSGNPLLRAKAMPTDDLIVLIDDDHQTAEETARRLRAGGFERVAVLAGGDLVLRFEGRPGLERQGSGSVELPEEDDTVEASEGGNL